VLAFAFGCACTLNIEVILPVSMSIETTVVGSFPKSGSPLEEAIRDVVELQLRYGIDLISDGELRGNMIQYFEQLPGLERVGDGLRIVGKVEPFERGEIDEFCKIKDYLTVRSLLKSLGRADVKAKVEITGPMTLGTICASSDVDSALRYYGSEAGEEALFFDFSRALLPVAERALELGAYVQVDEPLLSTGQVSVVSAARVLKDFVSRLPAGMIAEGRVLCHVCGSIRSVPGLYDVLLGLGFQVLSLGFSGEKEQENFDVISRSSFEGHGEKLGAGFISNISVEDQSTVMARFRRIEEAVGRENIRFVHPDCGFRFTPIKKVVSILETMKAVAEMMV
jgi:5-methyltetrahydropteroyltriglutamate--homocysteine methyltransferase